MSKNNIKVRVGIDKQGQLYEFDGRVLGFIRDDDTMAVVNLPEMPRRMYTSSTMSISDMEMEFAKHPRERLVIANATDHKIHITPHINCVTHIGSKRVLHCVGKYRYTFEEIHG